MAIIDLQNTLTDDECHQFQVPDLDEFITWVEETLEDHQEVELTIRLVDSEEIRTLNRDFRQKDKTTNVLSFPFENSVELDVPLLGDIVICAEVVYNEAQIQHKDPEEHWAHMVIHGTLHLLGYDHIDEKEAEEMEALEITILTDLGYTNPYH